ncbi:Phosphate-repressible phosphate permease [Aspergillus sp. HF37]|nr:Phosphate-repressible phosphate permease [Aspergillus sp. HF37]
MVASITGQYDWILALTTIFFVFAACSNGANDVANAYATSVAAKTLEMYQAGILAAITEFIGAVALGSRVASTIKDDIIGIDRFRGKPGTIMLAMGCAEFGNASWLTIASLIGFPVSTSQTLVGALVGVGFASESPVNWGWDSGGIAQIAASWGISPAISACFAAIIFGTVKYSVLNREDSFKWALRLIPVYLAFTGGILALFITIEAPTAPSLEAYGIGKIVGIILGVFFACLLVAYVFFLPYFYRRLVKQDTRVKFYHIPLGPLLLKDNPPIYFPSKSNEFVINYYEDAYGEVSAGTAKGGENNGGLAGDPSTSADEKRFAEPQADVERKGDSADSSPEIAPMQKKAKPGPRERFIGPVKDLPWFNVRKIWGYTKFILLQGVTRDVVSHDSVALRAIHARASRYDDRVEHLWTYCQVVSAMLMSIAHGSNDVANAAAPWAVVYRTFQSGEVNTKAPTPTWFLVIAGILLGAGFWVYGFHIIRVLGNKITQMSPTRGFSVELGAAITVLLASRLGLPVSTTQCTTGAVLGVA